MSADNGIFVFRLPGDGGFGVVHSTLSVMPMMVPDFLDGHEAIYGDRLELFTEQRLALMRAQRLAREFYDRRDILEYGIVDWTHISYDELMSPYLVEPVEETEEQMALRFQSLYRGD